MKFGTYHPFKACLLEQTKCSKGFENNLKTNSIQFEASTKLKGL